MQETRQRKEEMSLAQAAGRLDFDIFLPKSLPPGFELGQVRIFREKHGEGVLHLGYTDGLARISLFERTSEKTPAPADRSEIPFKDKSILLWKKGHFNILRQKEGHLSITVISGIPCQELIDMITSLERVELEEGGNVP
jgi:negative regulator of sigma E activity